MSSLKKKGNKSDADEEKTVYSGYKVSENRNSLPFQKNIDVTKEDKINK